MAYITRTNLRSYIGITGSNYDSILDTFVDAASEACDTFTGRVNSTLGAGFLTHSISNERHWVTNSSRVILKEWPVVSISSITLRGTAVTENNDFFLRKDTGVITFFDGSNRKKVEDGPVFVSYVAGYASVPNAVKQSCLRLGSYWFSRRQGEGMGAQLIGDIQETFRLPESRKILEEDLIDYKLDITNVGDS